MMLTLSPELEAAVFRLSKAVGKPAATVTRDLLEGVVPYMHALSETVEQAREKNPNALLTLLTTASSMMLDSAKVQEEVVRQVQKAIEAKKGGGGD